MSVPPRMPQCVQPITFGTPPNNRPSLPHIKYRIGTYSDIRAALLRKLDLDPLLSAWTHREPDDPGIALLEGAAILGDILTFYQELYANEAFLRTANWRESVADLVKLLGYRLSPGLGGDLDFALEVRGSEPVTVPAGFPIKADLVGITPTPTFETSAQALAYPALGRFNLYAPLDQPSIQQGTNYLRIGASGPTDLAPGDRLLVGSLDTSDHDPNNNFLDVSRLYASREIVIVDKVAQVLGDTVVKLKSPMQRASGTLSDLQLKAIRIKRSFHHFGFNAPKQDITITNGDNDPDDVKPVTAFKNIAYYRSLGAATATQSGTFTDEVTNQSVDNDTTVNPTLDPTVYPLHLKVDDLAPGRSVVIEIVDAEPVGNSVVYTTYAVRKTIASLRSGTMTWGSQTGSSTFVTIDNPISLNDIYKQQILWGDIQQIQIHEATSDPFTVAAPPDADNSRNVQSGTTLLFYDPTSQSSLLEQRPLLLQVSALDLAPKLVTASLKAPNDSNEPKPNAGGFGTPPLVPLYFSQTIDYSLYPNPYPDSPPQKSPYPYWVYGNIVHATQGKTEQTAVLGSGDNRQTFQTFKLPKAPLTYLSDTKRDPREQPETKVYVNGTEWSFVESLYNHGAREQIYIVRQDANGDSWVQFGDGQTGARLPSGLNNVTAIFRTGIGAFGPGKPGANPTAGARLDPLSKITVAGVATDGAQPETGDHARDAAPGQVQSLGRVVSLQDFETEAMRLSGVARARATWEVPNRDELMVNNALGADFVDAVAVVVRVLMQAGRHADFADAQKALTSPCIGSNRFPVCVLEGFFSYVFLHATLSIDPKVSADDVKLAIAEALGVDGQDGVDGSRGLFATAKRQFAQPEYLSRVKGVIQNVPGVIWVEMNTLGVADGVDPSDLSTFKPPAGPGPANERLIPDGAHLLRLYNPPGSNMVTLDVTPAPPNVTCSDG